MSKTSDKKKSMGRREEWKGGCTILDRWRCAVKLGRLVAYDEHGYLGAVLALVPNLWMRICDMKNTDGHIATQTDDQPVAPRNPRVSTRVRESSCTRSSVCSPPPRTGTERWSPVM